MVARFVVVCVLVTALVNAAGVGGGPPLVARRHARRDPESYPNPLISLRQVKADTLRRGTKTVQPRVTKRQVEDCPTPQVSGGCCPPGKKLCTQTSPAYCGDLTSESDCGVCGNQCSNIETCSSGVCQDCGFGYLGCNNQCVISDENGNCGSCTNVCGPGQTCYATPANPATGPWGFDYHCYCDATGYQNCNGACISTSDPSNCGSCGHTCGSLEYCGDGGCQECGYGYISCSNACIISDDDDNCGACGNTCSGGEICYAQPGGTGPWGFNYVCLCETGYQTCNGLCTSVDDPNNCGTCGTQCASGSCCNGECFYPLFDHANCGGCGLACSTTEICFNGQCQSCPTGQIYCQGLCVDASTYQNCGQCGNTCPYTQQCLVTSPGTGPWNENYACGCPTGYTLCNNECVWLPEDADNCGTCGKQCPAGHDCAGGQCCSDASPTSCNGACTSTQSDSQNCGTCGNACGAGTTCSGGQCVACANICGGECVDTSSDANNCGSCGNKCAQEGYCSGGSCLMCPQDEIWCGGPNCYGIEGLNCGTCDMSRCGSYHPGQICWVNDGGTGPWGKQYCCGGEFGAETDNCVG